MLSRSWFSVASSILVILLTSAVDAAQEEPAAVSTLEERVEVRLVQIAILALDEAGNPVTDLRPEEVTVLDRGKPVEVAFLDPIGPQPVPPVRVRLFVDVPGGPAGPVTNSGGEPRFYILFIDIDNEPPLGRAETAEAVLRFASESLDPSDQVAVVSFNGEINLESAFTTDPLEIVTAVASAFERSRRPRLDRGRRMRNLMVRIRACDDLSCISSATSSYELEVRSHGRDFIRALDGIVRYAGGLEGRKTVLAVSHGSALNPDYEVAEAINSVMGAGFAPPFGEGDLNLEMMDKIIELAIQRRVTLHFVSQPPRGRDAFGAWAATFPSAGARPLEAMQVQAQREMSHIAAATGGRLVVHGDPDHGLKKAIDLERSAYLLGYYLDRPPKPDKYRRTKITTTRRGVEIISPRGYYPNKRPRKRVDGDLVLGEPEASDPAVDGWQRIPFTISLDPQDLGYRSKKGVVSTNLTLETMVLLDDGRSLARAYHFVNHEVDASEKETEPVEIRGWAEFPPGAYELRVVVRNPRASSEGRFVTSVVVE